MLCCAFIDIQYREALDFATRALQAQERVLGTSHFDLANTIKIMSQIFLVLGRYAEAEQAQTRGVQIIEYLFGKTHMKLGLGLHQLGILKMKRGLYSEAGVLFDRAQTIVEVRNASTLFVLSVCLAGN